MKLGLLYLFAVAAVACGGSIGSVTTTPEHEPSCPVQAPQGTCPPGTDFERSYACVGDVAEVEPLSKGCEASVPPTESPDAGWYVVCCSTEGKVL